MKYGVLVDGEFEQRDIVEMYAKGFSHPMYGRSDTFDHYVMKEINRSYGKLEVENKVVLDVGANIGAFSCWALERNPSHVICLEPEVNNFQMLKLNVSYFSNENVENPFTLHNVALHSEYSGPEKLYLAKSGKNPGNSSTTERRGRIEIPIDMMSVSQLKEYHPVINAAKVDCEGAEYEFMKTFIEAYPDLEQIALEIHINGFDLQKAKDLNQMMIDNGFETQVFPRLHNNRLWQTLATYRRPK